MRTLKDRFNIPAQVKALSDLISGTLTGKFNETIFLDNPNYVRPPVKTPTPTVASKYVPQKTETRAGGYGKLARNPEAEKFDIGSSIVEAINQAAQQYNVPAELLYDIALQESGFNPQAQSQSSTAGGLFQFTEPTWQDALKYGVVPGGADKYDPNLNASAAAYFMSQGHLNKWDASKPKWGQFYKDEELDPYYSR